MADLHPVRIAPSRETKAIRPIAEPSGRCSRTCSMPEFVGLGEAIDPSWFDASNLCAMEDPLNKDCDTPSLRG